MDFEGETVLLIGRSHAFHSHQPPGVLFGSYSCEMKPRSPLSLLFPPLYLYCCNAHREKKKQQNFHCRSVLASSTSIYPHNSGWHLCGCHPSSVWLYPWSFPSFDIQLAHFSSAWSVLWATPILEVVDESQPVWFGMLIATHSLQLCWIGGCWTQGSSSHLFWLKQKAPQWLFSETQTEMEMAGNLGLDVSDFLYLKNLHC